MIGLEITEIGTVPKKIFIVPYRNRVQHKFFLSKYMTFLLEDEKAGDYEIYFSHQSDARPFNRGAAKNIGFLVMKQKYPNDYLNIDFIFNDVDTMPFNKIVDYSTTPGVVKHLYGFRFALGGIVIFKGGDFERVNGYPNFWGWGQEDNILQHRCNNVGLQIDRSQFYTLGDQNMLQLFEGVKRVITQDSHAHAKKDNGVDGISTIYGILYSITHASSNPADNVNVVDNPYIMVINIFAFECMTKYTDHDFETYDLRNKLVQKQLVQMNLSQTQPQIQQPRQIQQIQQQPFNNSLFKIRMVGLQ